MVERYNPQKSNQHYPIISRCDPKLSVIQTITMTNRIRSFCYYAVRLVRHLLLSRIHIDPQCHHIRCDCVSMRASILHPSFICAHISVLIYDNKPLIHFSRTNGKYCFSKHRCIHTLTPWQMVQTQISWRHFQMHFLKRKKYILIKISLFLMVQLTI